MCDTKTFIKILSQILFRYRQAKVKLSMKKNDRVEEENHEEKKRKVIKRSVFYKSISRLEDPIIPVA